MKNLVATTLLAIIILFLIGCQQTDGYKASQKIVKECVNTMSFEGIAVDNDDKLGECIYNAGQAANDTDKKLEGVKLDTNYDTTNFNNKKDVFKIFDSETCHMIYVTENGGMFVVNIKDIWRTAGELREMFPGCGT